MSIYTPYFYIIQNSINGMYYAGVRYAKTCHPKELLKEDGYHTSSETVKEVIKKLGLEVFVIRKIKTFTSKDEVLKYETRFLNKINARKNPSFYNKSNNEGVLGREEAVLLKYGTNSYFKTAEFANRMKKLSLERYGVEHHLMASEIIEKRANTLLDRYGVDNFTKTDLYLEKTKETNLKKYGTEWYQSTDVVKQKSRSTQLEKYGHDHHNKTKEYKNYVRNEKTSKSQRPIVTEMRDLSKKTGIKLGRGWYQKSEEELADMRKRLFGI